MLQRANNPTLLESTISTGSAEEGMKRLHTLHSFDRYLSLYILFSRNPTLPLCVVSTKLVWRQPYMCLYPLQSLILFSLSPSRYLQWIVCPTCGNVGCVFFFFSIFEVMWLSSSLRRNVGKHFTNLCPNFTNPWKRRHVDFSPQNDVVRLIFSASNVLRPCVGSIRENGAKDCTID